MTKSVRSLIYNNKFLLKLFSKSNFLKKITRPFTPTYKLNKYLKKINEIKNNYNTSDFILENGNIYLLREGGLRFKYVDSMANYALINKWEPSSIEFIKNKLKNGDVFFDIGAHIGDFCLEVANKNENIDIYAFEANPHIFELLKYNVNINYLDKTNINLINSAISDNNNGVYISNDKFGGNNIFKNKNNNSEFIESLTLDDFVEKNNINKISLIKADIEGAEYMMLKGASNTLKKFKPGLFLEINPESLNYYNIDINKIFQLVERYGYECKYIFEDDKKIKFEKFINDGLTRNYYFEYIK